MSTDDPLIKLIRCIMLVGKSRSTFKDAPRDFDIQYETSLVQHLHAYTLTCMQQMSRDNYFAEADVFDICKCSV